MQSKHTRKKTKFHFITWNMDAWCKSATRAFCRGLAVADPNRGLGMMAEGTYKCLLEYCYLDGDLPADEKMLALLCGLPVELFREVWVAFGHNFHASKTRPGRLVSDEVNARLRAYEKFCLKQAENGRRGGIKKASKNPPRNTNGFNDFASGGLAVGTPPLSYPINNKQEASEAYASSEENAPSEAGASSGIARSNGSYNFEGFSSECAADLHTQKNPEQEKNINKKEKVLSEPFHRRKENHREADEIKQSRRSVH